MHSADIHRHNARPCDTFTNEIYKPLGVHTATKLKKGRLRPRCGAAPSVDSSAPKFTPLHRCSVSPLRDKTSKSPPDKSNNTSHHGASLSYVIAAGAPYAELSRYATSFSPSSNHRPSGNTTALATRIFRDRLQQHQLELRASLAVTSAAIANRPRDALCQLKSRTNL